MVFLWLLSNYSIWFQLPRGIWFSSNYNSSLIELVTTLTQQIFDRNAALPNETTSANRSLALFLKSLLSLLDRGKVFEMIRCYWAKFGCINMADGKGIVRLRLDFLLILVTHEHFVQLNLPSLNKKNQGTKCNFKNSFV